MTRWEAVAWLREVTWEVSFNPDTIRSDRWCGQAWDRDRQVTVTVRDRTEAKARRRLERAVAGRRKVAAAVLANQTRGVMPPASPLSGE